MTERLIFIFVYNQMIPLTINIREVYSTAADRDQQFIQNLALFLCAFLKEHGQLLEKQAVKLQLTNALQYLVLISDVDDVEIFKICLEYWNALTSDLYK